MWSSDYNKYIIIRMEQYGIRMNSLEWIKSYLASRTQRILVGGDGSEVLSEPTPIEIGIPQGSVLGIHISTVHRIHRSSQQYNK
ncbi:hypothetical protein WA026_019739 [Henosepilachna vigintioctopunctata]|uniref:Reverse transcriptase domain-containing protein n=1 Tax=Henosepilachna vigintioctopunctata TaxID=420089 RepID=A0AAW1URT4_9CUCU